MRRTRLPLLAVGAGLLLSACSRWEVKPEAPKAMPLSRQPALPLKVGVVEDQKSLKLSPFGRDSGGPRKLTDALRYSGLFREVEGASPGASPSGYDLLVTWSGEVTHHVGIFPFLPLCDPLILGCFLDNTDNSQASLQAAVVDSSGRQVKSYAESQQAVLVYQILALGHRRDSVESALENAVAKIVTDFINDRPFYKGVRRGAPAPEPAEQPAPEAAPASAPASALAPAPEPAPQPAAEQAAPPPPPPPPQEAPRKLTPSQARQLDEQIVP